ncbi:MAG: GNAT family N-acetyltransferase [Anaerolineae bacterium]|nr:GNAT family N-acetyltransferase [Anaerolineae bacterium]MBL8104700.1 GNAT family N-acetyltransferase [Anaerolineales bacterium]MCC7188204.1 GNAT family N-acetyltransferase [Anaerolineales bacterium]
MPSNMNIITPQSTDRKFIQQAAQLLVDAFREHWPDAWPTMEDGLEEANELFEEGNICRAAVGNDGNLLGFIGGIPQYDGHVWELHPLAVQPSEQGKGIGRALVKDFESRVRERGGLTITLGSDDENNMTSLSNVDLYENLWDQVKNIRNIKGHPFEFYQKMGFVITGVMPDANGRGKPDILMSKRVER